MMDKPPLDWNEELEHASRLQFQCAAHERDCRAQLAAAEFEVARITSQIDHNRYTAKSATGNWLLDLDFGVIRLQSECDRARDKLPPLIEDVKLAHAASQVAQAVVNCCKDQIAARRKHETPKEHP